MTGTSSEEQPRKPRSLTFPADSASNPKTETPKAPRPLSIPAAAPAMAAEPKPSVKPLATSTKPVEFAPQPVRKRTKTDDLIDRAVAIDPTIEGFNIRARIDHLLGADTMQIMRFGESNTAALQDATARQAKIAHRISQINAMEWIKETAEASCRIPGLLDRFTAKKPEFYQAKLKGAQTELEPLVRELGALMDLVRPDLTDLKHDTIAIQVVAESFDDDLKVQTADRRLRTLLGALQTVMMLMQSLENTHTMCIDHVGRIDELLSVTIPNWIMANRA